MPIPSLSTLKLYFNGSKYHSYYSETVKMYQAFRFHANGEVANNSLTYASGGTSDLSPATANTRFNDLIIQRRPNESDYIQRYRQCIYVPKTKNPITKVVTSLSKIRRSPDWNIDYTGIKWPARIPAEETLEQYCEKNYPGYASVTNWMFTIALKNQCIDANAVVAVFPREFNIEENKFFKPEAFLFNSSQVIYYEEGNDWAILQSAQMSDINKGADSVAYQTGKIFYVISSTEFFKFEQVSAAEEYANTQYYQHNFGYLPVFKIPAVFLAQKNNSIIQESRLAPMLADLDEAAREYSDLQATKVQHMYPLLWYFENKDCPACEGVGKLPTQSETGDSTYSTGSSTCTSCGGSGKIKFSPYTVMAVAAPKLGEQTIPTPPAGYVSRDVEIIKHQEESVQQHCFDALSAINMQFLDQTPLSISGDAKNVDREELNNFVYNVAEDVVAIMDKIYFIINDWRYSFAIPDKKGRYAMLPKIAVPQNFDLLPSGYLMDDIVKAKASKVNPVLVATMETQYANKMFYTEPELSEKIDLIYNLDPLPGITEDEKMVRLSNKGVTQQDYIISSNIVAFVKRAIIENKGFVDMHYEDQMAILQKYAEAKQKEMSAAAKVLQAVPPADQATNLPAAS